MLKEQTEEGACGVGIWVEKISKFYHMIMI